MRLTENSSRGIVKGVGIISEQRHFRKILTNNFIAHKRVLIKCPFRQIYVYENRLKGKKGRKGNM